MKDDEGVVFSSYEDVQVLAHRQGVTGGGLAKRGLGLEDCGTGDFRHERSYGVQGRGARSRGRNRTLGG